MSVSRTRNPRRTTSGPVWPCPRVSWNDYPTTTDVVQLWCRECYDGALQEVVNRRYEPKFFLHPAGLFPTMMVREMMLMLHSSNAPCAYPYLCSAMHRVHDHISFQQCTVCMTIPFYFFVMAIICRMVRLFWHWIRAGRCAAAVQSRIWQWIWAGC